MKYGLIVMCQSAADISRLIAAAESIGASASPVPGASLPPAPGNPLPPAPGAGVTPPPPPTAAPAAPIPAPAPPLAPAPVTAAPAGSPSDQQAMIQAMQEYIQLHGADVAMKAFQVYQCPPNVGQLNPQQFATMLQVFQSKQRPPGV